MLNKIQDEFKQELGEELNYFYSRIKKDIPEVPQWQFELSSIENEHQEKINFMAIRGPLREIIGTKMTKTNSDKTKKTTVKVYGTMFFLEELEQKDEDYIKRATNLIKNKDNIRKICCFSCNDETITVLVEKSQESKDLTIIVNALDEGKVKKLLEPYKEKMLSINEEEIIDITALLEEIYYNNFYNKDYEPIINNKIRERKLDK